MKLFKQVKKYGARIVAPASSAALMLFATASAHAAGIDDVLDAVDLSTVAATITALSLIVVSIALVFKGPDIAKRIIRKV